MEERRDEGDIDKRKCPYCGAEFDLTDTQYQMTTTQEILVRCPNNDFLLVVGSEENLEDGWDIYSFEVTKR